jgi:two-component system invasion response regulator UvrY
MKGRMPRLLLDIQSTIFRQALELLLRTAGFEVLTPLEAPESPQTRRRMKTVAAAILDGATAVHPVPERVRDYARRAPPIPWILLAESAEDPDNILSAFRAGASAYVVKTQPAAELIEAVHSVLDGDLYLSPDVGRRIFPRLLSPAKDLSGCVTDHETDLIKMIAEGKTVAQAAAVLGIDAGVASRDHSRLKRKLGLKNTAALVRYAVRHGIIAA